jgi:hypothetical protein
MNQLPAICADLTAELDSVLSSAIEAKSTCPGNRAVIRQYGKKLLKIAGEDGLLASARLIVARNAASSDRNDRIAILQRDWTGLAEVEPPTRKRLHTRLRKRELRKRMADAKRQRGNRVRFYQVPMLDTEVNELLLQIDLKELRIRRADDRRIITDLEWRGFVGRVIADAARKTVK